MNDKEFTPSRYRWALHALAVLYFTMGFMVRFAWPPLIPVASVDLGINMSSAGLYMSAFYIGYVLAQIPGGLLGDRFGVRLVIGTALIIEAAGTFGVGVAPNFATGFAFRVLTGLGAGVIYSSCIRYVTSLFPPKETGLAFGLLMMAPSGVGVILPNLIMPWLNTMLSWRGAFQAMSAMVLLMGLVAFIFVRDVPARAKGGKRVMCGLKDALRNRNLILMALGGFWMMWIMVAFVSWGNSYIKALGFGMEKASLVMTVYGLAGVCISPLGGMLAQKVASPKRYFMAVLLTLAPSLLLFGQAESLFVLATLAGTVGILLGLGNPILPVLTSRYAGKELVATAGGVTGCIFQSGAIVGPWVAGLSVDLTGSFSAAWLSMALAALAGMICLMPMRDC